MARIPRSSVIPPNGFHFIDHSTGVEKRIEGSSYEDVADRVLKFRLANGKEPGNPAAELIDYVCGTWPHFCSDDSPRGPKTVTSRARHLSTRVAGWLATFYSLARADAGVGGGESQRRAGICAQCPQNREYRDGGCGSCLESISRLFFVWRRDRPIPHEAKLGACGITSQLNAAAVMAKTLPPLTAEQIELLPGNCWRKGETAGG